MIPNTSYNVATVQVSKLPIQCVQIEGYFKGTTAARWLQVHDSCITPASNAVPVYELPINQTAQFFENLQVDHLNLTEGLFVGVSTAEGTWTASTDAMDITVWTDVVVPTANIVGDKTSSVNTLQVWAQNVSSKVLYQLIITNQNSSTAFYALIYAANSPSQQTAPFLSGPDYGNYQSLIAVPANSTVKKGFNFSFSAGQQFQSLVPPSTLYTGCNIFISDTIPTMGGTITADSNATILAVTN